MLETCKMSGKQSFLAILSLRSQACPVSIISAIVGVASGHKHRMSSAALMLSPSPLGILLVLIRVWPQAPAGGSLRGTASSLSNVPLSEAWAIKGVVKHLAIWPWEIRSPELSHCLGLQSYLDFLCRNLKNQKCLSWMDNFPILSTKCLLLLTKSIGEKCRSLNHMKRSKTTLWKKRPWGKVAG